MMDVFLSKKSAEVSAGVGEAPRMNDWLHASAYRIYTT